MALKKGTLITLQSEMGSAQFESDHAVRLLELNEKTGNPQWWLPNQSKYEFVNGSLRPKSSSGKTKDNEEQPED